MMIPVTLKLTFVENNILRMKVIYFIVLYPVD